MKYVQQFSIILLISVIGEVLKTFLPLPVPASVYGAGLITAWSSLKPICVPVLIMTFISTVIVMVVTGKVTQGVIRMGKRGTEK